MATWEDGPEYAPVTRPDGYDVPSVPALEQVPPRPEMASAPSEQPRFDQPEQPQAPLASLAPPTEQRRDPGEPFAVVSSSLTSGAWGSAHGVRGEGAAPMAVGISTSSSLLSHVDTVPTAPAAAPPLGSSPALPPSSGPLPPPSTGSEGAIGPGGPGGYPQPGTPQWFATPRYGEQPTEPGRVDAKAVLTAATPGLLIVLGLAVIISTLAPVLMLVAFALSRRVHVAQQQVARAFGIGLAVTVASGVLSYLVNGPYGVVEWWTPTSSSARFVALVLLVVTPVLVQRALRRRHPGGRGPGGTAAG